MSDGLRNFMFMLVVAGLLAVSYYLYNNNLKSKALKGVTGEKVAFDAVVSSLEGDSSVLPGDYTQAPERYLVLVLRAIKANSFVGISVFSQKAKDTLYQDFIQRVIAFRDALVSYAAPQQMDNQQKKDIMRQIVTQCDRLFQKELADPDKGGAEDSILKKWSDVDRQKLYIRDNELPEEQVAADDETSEDTSTSKPNYSQFNVKDGYTMSGEETEVGPENKEPKAEKVRSVVDFTQLKTCVGQLIEVQKKNGTRQEGRLIEATDTFLILEVAVLGGNLSIKFLKTEIEIIHKVALKKAADSGEDN